MVDLRKLLAKGGRESPIDPLQIFEGLDRKTSHVNLRPFQITALQDLHRRRAERDLVLKMPTGAGKSTVGLLFLKSHMVESRGAGVYLCPTLQLADQVLLEARRLGLDAHPYGRGEKFPHADCLAGQAIIVCTYDKLFNAKTTFDRSDVNVVPDALVLDDAHAGVEEVRDAFTLRVEDAEAMKEIVELLDARMKEHLPSAWQDVKEGDPRVLLEVPYWHLADVQDEITSIVERFAKPIDKDLRWPLIRTSMPLLRCVIGRGTIEFTVEIPAVRQLRPYHEAAHRLYMSGTLSDDTVLVRELDCDMKAALEPVVPSTESGIGERMVLAPALLDPTVMDRDWVIEWAAKRSQDVSVVVLCSSEDDAAAWEEAGAATPVGHDDVSRVVKELRKGELKFAAFAQRFDGVDLPDDACRILIIDGIPRGQSLCDDIDAAAHARDGGVRNRVVYRIEQGMGRAVRSSADYAVVVLAGAGLASFVSKTAVRAQMSAEVQAQFVLGRELIDLARSAGQASAEEAFDDLVDKCLRRTREWKDVYNEKVRTQVAGRPLERDEPGIRLARAERTSLMSAVDGDVPSAVETLSTALNKAKLQPGPTYARYLQTLARVQFGTDRDEASRIQRKAFAQSPRLLRPPPVRAAKTRDAATGAAADRVLKWYSGFAEGQGAVAHVTDGLGDLRFGVAHSVFEDAVELVGQVIGAQSTRPERDEGEGPDNLWRWKDDNLVIECKSKSDAPSISKRNLGQITMSTSWFEREFPSNPATPIMIVDTTQSDVEPDQRLLVVTSDGLAEIKKRVLSFVKQLSTRSATIWTKPEVAALLEGSGLTPKQLVEETTKSPRKKRGA
jgi:hypothetical protein